MQIKKFDSIEILPLSYLVLRVDALGIAQSQWMILREMWTVLN